MCSETFRAASGTIDGWESELGAEGAAGHDHFFRASGGGAACGNIDDRESELRADNSDNLLLEGSATGRAHFFSDSRGCAAWIVLELSIGISVNVGEDCKGC